MEVIQSLIGLQRNQKYVEECGYYDNGRLKTWLPYKKNQDSSALVHDISQETLLGDQEDKYYLTFYKGPQVSFFLAANKTLSVKSHVTLVFYLPEFGSRPVWLCLFRSG